MLLTGDVCGVFPGMICPHIVNWSMLLGAILSWGIMWPLMEKREGDWYVLFARTIVTGYPLLFSDIPNSFFS
jgi:hypothetical protein